MNYRLNRQGTDMGVFPLEELRRRKQIGELTGTEHVWTEGWTEWQPLDTVLQTHPQPPPPIPANTPNSKVVKVIIVVAVIGTLAIAIGNGVRIFKAMRSGIARGPEAYDAQGAADKPVATTANTIIEADARQRARKFRERQWLEGYEQRGQRDQPCDDEAQQLIQSWQAEVYGGAEATNLPPPGPLADKLAAMSGCDDPLILTVTGVLSTELHEKINRLERALKGFEQSRHRAYPKFYAAVMLAGEMNNDRGRRGTLDAFALQRYKELFTDGSIHPEDQVELAEILVNGWGYNFFWRNRQAVYSAVPPGKPYAWLQQVLEGEYHIIQSWQLRGSGYANTVSKQGWQGFANESALARKCYTKAFETQTNQPLAPCRLIYVSLGDGNIGEMRKWFDQTIAVQVDYSRAWSDFGWGLRPRWYGDLPAMLGLGATALNTGRFDTDVPRKLYDAINDVESEMTLPPGEHIYGRADVWPLLQRMYEGYIAEPSEAANQKGWRSTFAAVAYIAGKYEVARDQLEAVHWQPYPNNLTGWGIDMTLAPLEVAARTGKAGAEIARAESSRADGDIKTALERYRELNQATNTDARTKEFIHYRLAALEPERKLLIGEWIDGLPSMEKDPNWIYSEGSARRLPDGAVEVEASKDGHLLYSRVRVGAEFEVTGDFEIVQSSSKDFQAGLVMGLPELNQGSWFAFRMKRNAVEGQVAMFTRGWTKNGKTVPISLNDGRNSFVFRFKGGKVSAALNGKEIFKDADAPGTVFIANDSFMLGLGAFNDMNETLIRYRNVRVHRLTEPGK